MYVNTTHAFINKATHMYANMIDACLESHRFCFPADMYMNVTRTHILTCVFFLYANRIHVFRAIAFVALPTCTFMSQ